MKDINTCFYACALDEEDNYLNPAPLDEGLDTVMTGTVTGVGPDEFMLDTGLQKIEVEVDEMACDPLDDKGYQQIDIGDRVSVTGDIDYDFFEGRVFEAASIETLWYNQ